MRELALATGLPTLCLRPPAVWVRSAFAEIRAAWEQDPRFEWEPYWEYGAFVDVCDAAQAGLRGLQCELGGHARVLLCARDISSAGETSRRLALFATLVLSSARRMR